MFGFKAAVGSHEICRPSPQEADWKLVHLNYVATAPDAF